MILWSEKNQATRFNTPTNKARQRSIRSIDKSAIFTTPYSQELGPGISFGFSLLLFFCIQKDGLPYTGISWLEQIRTASSTIPVSLIDRSNALNNRDEKTQLPGTATFGTIRLLLDQLIKGYTINTHSPRRAL